MKTDLKPAQIDLEDFIAEHFRDIPEPAHASPQDHLNWIESQIAAPAFKAERQKTGKPCAPKATR